jgi:hypothetical protein
MMADYVMVYNLTLEMTDEERERAIEKAFVRARTLLLRTQTRLRGLQKS